jgi:hypothetical protein
MLLLPLLLLLLLLLRPTSYACLCQLAHIQDSRTIIMSR